MDYAQLKAMGVVESHPMVRHEFTIRYFPLLPKEQWKDPNIEERAAERAEAQVTVYLRSMTAADQIAAAAANRAKRDPVYLMIHRCVFKEDGGRLFESEEQATEIDLDMFAGLINGLNKLHGGSAKKSQPRMKRGASSRSPSAAAASKSGSRKSVRTSGTSGPSTERRTAHSTPV
jgi:hypothetical protein